jgi:quercetin dioxygenase-like cupin family protein
MPPLLNKRKFTIDSDNGLSDLLKQQGYSLFSWRDAAGSYYSLHQHDHDEYIIVCSGKIVFTVDGVDYELEPGDELILPANTVHTASVAEAVKYFICTRP